MADLGYPLMLTQLKLKVSKLTQDWWTPFNDGILGSSWVKWFLCRHPNITLQSSEGLEIARARGLCLINVATLYGNLVSLYAEHSYACDHIWNLDETGAEAGRSGGGHIFARRSTSNVHNIIPNERE